MIKHSGSFEVSAEGKAVVVSLSGEIDHHNATALRTGIDKLICEKRPKKLVLDLANIAFMDSSGLGLIMGRYALVKHYGGNVSVLDPSPAVIKIMKLAGMERIVPIKKTKEKEK